MIKIPTVSRIMFNKTSRNKNMITSVRKSFVFFLSFSCFYTYYFTLIFFSSSLIFFSNSSSVVIPPTKGSEHSAPNLKTKVWKIRLSGQNAKFGLTTCLYLLNWLAYAVSNINQTDLFKKQDDSCFKIREMLLINCDNQTDCYLVHSFVSSYVKIF